MGDIEKDLGKRTRIAKIQLWMAARASRNRSMLDRIVQPIMNRILDKALELDPENDFMTDDIVNSNIGYTAEDLERYQRGEDDPNIE